MKELDENEDPLTASKFDWRAKGFDGFMGFGYDPETEECCEDCICDDECEKKEDSTTFEFRIYWFEDCADLDLSVKFGDKEAGYSCANNSENEGNYTFECLNEKEIVKELSKMAVGYYAIIENAYRHRKKINILDHKSILADLYEEFSEIAVNNKYGWSETNYKAADIKTSSLKNKYQAFPYNKYHCTSWNVNQASATIICNESIADKLSIPINKRVYPVASSENNAMTALIQRPNLSSCIGMNLAADFIQKIVKKNKQVINFYDLYSCFPVAIEMFAESLQIPLNKNCTITGGMSFAGGPLNHYVLTSTNQLIRKLRAMPEKIGLITGVSGVMTKQSYALWSGKFIQDFKFKDVTSKVTKIEKPINLSLKSSGIAKIISYTIIEEKINFKKAIIYGEINKERIILSTNNKKIMKDMEINEWIGKEVKFTDRSLV